MRIIRLKLKTATRNELAKVSTAFRVSDRGFIEDLYALCLLKGNGLPTDMRLKALVAHYTKVEGRPAVVINVLLKRRADTLSELTRTALFNRLLASNKSAFEMTRRLMSVYTKLNRKIAQMVCCACQYLSKCDFGMQYKDKFRDIRSVIDPDYKKKVHQACPEIPKIDGSQAAYAALLEARKLREEAESQASFTVNSANKGSRLPTSELTPAEVKKVVSNEEAAAKKAAETLKLDSDLALVDPEKAELSVMGIQDEGLHFAESADTSAEFVEDGNDLGSHIIDEAFVSKLSAADLLLMRLATILDGKLGSHKQGHFKPSESVTKDKDSTAIKSIAEEHKILPSQHGLPDDVRQAKLEKKELKKVEHKTPEKKKAILYLLIDCSGSMRDVAQIMNGVMASKAAIAATFALAVTRKVEKEGGLVFARFFNENAGSLDRLETPDDYKAYHIKMGQRSFSGGGTNIPRALAQAVDDITAAKDVMRKAEILMITDAEDYIDQATVGQLVKDVPLNILDVTPKTHSSQGLTTLMSVADNYYKLDGRSIDLDKMVELVGGEKKTKNPSVN